MQTIGERIRIARKKEKLTQQRVADHLGGSQGMVSDWERNVYEPHRSQMPRLAKLFNVTRAYLELGLTTTPSGGELSAITQSVVDVPIIDWIEAGQLADTTDPYPLGHIEETVPVASKADTLIGLRITGTSMDREFPPGTVIIVDYADKTLLDGKFYVFRVRGSTTCKRYRSTPPRLEPFSHDDTHDSIFPTEPVEVVGRVIFAQRRY